jgi:GntR family transcriptional regulator
VRFVVDVSGGRPLYLQLAEQIRHAIETGVLRPGDTLPAIRTLAQQLVMSPNTVVKAYDALGGEGWIESRPGSGAYVTQRRGAHPRVERLRSAQEQVRALMTKLRAEGTSDDEVRRLFEAELMFSEDARGRA